MIDTVHKYLARIKRRMNRRPYWKDKRYPGYWFDKILGGRAGSVVQIGSNDGKTGDPLFPLICNNPEWRALFVEPIPFYFEKLKENYGTSERFSFENAAINNGEALTFHWVDPALRSHYPDLPFWVDQIGSFDRSHITKVLDGDLDSYIISKEINCLSMEELLCKHEVNSIDLLHIDAEGHDWEVLRQFDLPKYQPKAILFEFAHLKPYELEAAQEFLSDYYLLYTAGQDIFCLSRNSGKDLLQQLDRSMPKYIPISHAN